MNMREPVKNIKLLAGIKAICIQFIQQLPVICLIEMLILLPMMASAQDPFSLVEDGVPQASIYVHGPVLNLEIVKAAMSEPVHGTLIHVKLDDASVKIEENDFLRSVAIHELNYHLQKMTGAPLPVITTSDINDIVSPAIVLGALANQLGAGPKINSPTREAFRLLSQDQMLLIGSESDLATRHGVYEFLKTLGVDWVMPGEIGEIIPQKTTVEIKQIDISFAPDFQNRRIWYRGYSPLLPEEVARFQLWRWRHKGQFNRTPVEQTQGHRWQVLIRQNEDVFAADPTMLALVLDREGEFVRRGPQIEATHPRVVELFAEQIRKTYASNIKAGRWTSSTAAGFGIGPADGQNFSLSAGSIAAGSRRTDAIMGAADNTDLLVRLANAILEQVSTKYPNAVVGYYSYSAHADYPLRYLPHRNLAQVFAPINFSRFHGVTDPISKTQTFYRGVVDKWAELSQEQGNPLSYYGYNWNLADNMLPYTKVQIWGEDLPYYFENGLSGVTLEATKQWSVLAPSDYVFMNMAWDTSQDWRILLHDFSQKAYGKGAEPMLHYWNRLIDTQRNAGMEAGSYHAFSLIYDKAWVEFAEADITQAMELADTASDKTRIRYVGIGLEFLRLYLDYHEATLNFDFEKSKVLYEAILSHWQQAYDENTDLVASEVPGYLAQFLGEFIDGAYLLSTGEFSIVEPLPDELTTAFDPYVAGERLGLNQFEIRDERFIKTKTISSTWDAQGLGGLRDGAVWYRWRFNLSDDFEGKPIGLFLGGVEDTAHVWLNGEKVGGAGPAFSKPMVFDLTSEVNYDEENMLAVQVVRTSKLNELGLGGILRPSFLFTGPFEGYVGNNGG